MSTNRHGAPTTPAGCTPAPVLSQDRNVYNIQFEPPLVQLCAIVAHAATGSQEQSQHIPLHPPHGAAESTEVASLCNPSAISPSSEDTPSSSATES